MPMIYKFDDKAVLGHLVGYINDKDGYKVWIPSKHRLVKMHDVDFRPEKLCTTNDVIELELQHSPEDSGGGPEQEQELHTTADSDTLEEEPAVVVPRHPVRATRQPAKLNDYEVGYKARQPQANSAAALLTETVLQDIEPTNFTEAMKSSDSDNWTRAMEEEIQAFKENDTWDLVQLPPGKHAIDNRWILRLKYKPDGSIDRYRARLVVRGIFQRAGLDYDEMFSPVARYDAIRALIATAAEEKLVLGQFDVRTAFLYGDIDTEVFMTQPQGFDDGSGRVCRLKKSLWSQAVASLLE